MENVFLQQSKENVFIDDDLSMIPINKIKISWKGFVLLHDYVKNEFILGHGGFELPDMEERFVLVKDGVINIPNGFKCWKNGNLLFDKEITLDNDVIKMNNGNLTIEIENTLAGKKFGSPLVEDKMSWLYIMLSGVAHIMLILGIAMFMPPLGLTDNEEMTKDNLFLIQQYLKASSEREMEAKETEQVAEDKADDKEGGTGTRAAGSEGAMGNPNSRDTNKKYGIAGPKDNKDPHLAREAALREAKDFGMIGLLNTGAGGDPNSPTAIWGRDDSSGFDAISARGNMWGSEIGESFGTNGLGLSGIGEGGNGKGEGIGLGAIGTIGHGSGAGASDGFGNGHGKLMGGHKVKTPQVRMGMTSVSGRIPPEIVQRVIRQNYGKFRMCFENGLRNNPNLNGRVTTRFVINRDGSVSNASNGGSDLPDQGVVQCVVRSFYGLSFPAPETGIVTVVYPIMFTSN